MDDLIGREIGHYIITEFLGEGGMAEVYKAHQPSLNRDVAIKTLTGPLARDEEFVARFRREAVVAGSLGHPNILTVHDAGTTPDGLAYIVMEYAPGGTLGNLLYGGPLPPAQACQIGAQVAMALDAAHRREIVHRDLKPSNVLLVDDGRPLLMDFGVALISSGTRLTRTGLAVGTPEYMSPEQAQGLTVDARSDVYSLGILMWEMLTGEAPFTADTPLATLYKQANDPLPALNAVAPTVPAWLSSVVSQALAKEPADRFQTAKEMAQALRGQRAPRRNPTRQPAVAAHASPPAAPEPKTASPRRRGRNRWLLPTMILAAAITVIACIYLFVFLPALWQEPDDAPGI